MYKVIFSSLMLLSAASYADNTPTFDFSTNILTLPFVKTSQANYRATLHFNPNLPALTFEYNANDISVATVANDTTTPATFDFSSGKLTLPKINTVNGPAGTYSATLKLNNNTFFLNPTDLHTYVPPSAAGDCPIFPANNVWNTPVNTLKLHSRSAAWINSISSRGLHADFGESNGQPLNLVSGSQVPAYTFNFRVPGESDIGPYPIPDNPLIEQTEDQRLFIIDKETCKLHEVYNAENKAGQWSGKRGAIWDLKSNALRPLGWASADEAGLPEVPGLVRWEEVNSGVIKHALRFTHTTPSFRVWPARHAVGTATAVNDALPMGARLRLNEYFDITPYAPELQVILQAMKTYGIILADTGQSLFLSGTPDGRWSDDILSELSAVKGFNFEAVDTTCMMVSADSGEASLKNCK